MDRSCEQGKRLGQEDRWEMMVEHERSAGAERRSQKVRDWDVC